MWLVAAAQIHQVGNLLEHEEADAERQHDVPGLMLDPKQRRHVVDGEIGVFEAAENREIEDDAQGRQARHQFLAMRPGDQPVGDRQAGQERNETPIPIAVKHQGRGDDDPLAQRMAPSGQIVEGKNDRQEREDERLRVEQHLGARLVASAPQGAAR